MSTGDGTLDTEGTMKDREDIINLIADLLTEHIGWRNAIPARELAELIGVKPNQLRADKYSKGSRGLISELKVEGVEVLSCVKGYYLSRPGHLGGDEDREKDKSWNERHAYARHREHKKTRKAPVRNIEVNLFD